MIKINAITNTKDSNGNSALALPTGVLLNITPYPRDRVEDVDGTPTTIYSVSFDVALYKDMAAYDANDVLINSDMFEYPIGHTVDNVDIQALTSISDLLALYQDVVENGTGDFPGVGSGNTELVYPTV